VSPTLATTCFELRPSQLLNLAHSFGPKSPLENPITLSAQDTLTVSLTAKDSGKAKRPHQAFLLLKDESGLEAPFPLSVKESGKAKVQIVGHNREVAERNP
jgi:oligosaccharyltransferase complex subunit delta (ribophorin II)